MAPIVFILSIPLNSIFFLINIFYSDKFYKGSDNGLKNMITIETLLEFNKIVKKLVDDTKADKTQDVTKADVVGLNKLA